MFLLSFCGLLLSLEEKGYKIPIFLDEGNGVNDNFDTSLSHANKLKWVLTQPDLFKIMTRVYGLRFKVL